MVVTSEAAQAPAADGIGPSRSAKNRPPVGAFVAVVTLLSGVFMAGAGVWALAWPRDFAEFVKFDYNEHFLHDAGAFQNRPRTAVGRHLA